MCPQRQTSRQTETETRTHTHTLAQNSISICWSGMYPACKSKQVTRVKKGQDCSTDFWMLDWSSSTKKDWSAAHWLKINWLKKHEKAICWSRQGGSWVSHVPLVFVGQDRQSWVPGPHVSWNNVKEKYICSDVSHTRPAAAGLFRKTQSGRGCLWFHTESKRPDTARPWGRSTRGRSKYRRPHEAALLALCWRPAVGKACLPRCRGKHTNAPSIHDPPDRCVGRGVVQLASAEFAGWAAHWCLDSCWSRRSRTRQPGAFGMREDWLSSTFVSWTGPGVGAAEPIGPRQQGKPGRSARESAEPDLRNVGERERSECNMVQSTGDHWGSDATRNESKCSWKPKGKKET